MTELEPFGTIQYRSNWRSCDALLGQVIDPHEKSTKHHWSTNSLERYHDSNGSGKSSMTAVSREIIDILVSCFRVMCVSNQNVKHKGTSKNEKTYNGSSGSSTAKESRVASESSYSGTGRSESGRSGQFFRSYKEDENDEDDKDNKRKGHAESKETGTDYICPDEEDIEVTRTADMLADIFPAIPRSQLLARAMSCKNVDLIVEELFAEDAGQSPKNAPQTHSYPDDVFLVKDMFPDRDLADIDRVLRQHGRNVEEAVSALLQNRSVRATTTNSACATQATTDSPSAGSSANIWSALQQDVEQIKHLLHVPPSVARGYLHRHNGQIYRAIVDIISTYHRSRADEQQPTRQKLGGRVQGQSVSGGKAKAEVPSSLLPLQSPSESSGQASDQFADDSAASAELAELYENSSELRMLCKEFLDNTLRFTDGNIDRVLQISSLFIESNSAALTFPSRNTTVSRSRGPQSRLAPTLSYAASPATSTARQSSPASSSSNKEDRSSPTVNAKLSSAFQTNTLDLHNLNVADALEAASKALVAWWDEESTQRKSQGKLSSYGFSSVFVLPLTIISGRGIHSKDGKSPIKVAIRKHLAKHGYVYEESSAKFKVHGRRC
ncbi:Piso0_001794 [Millerozyma farinosa CBS 7064]|uniref:Piso0_001794 protein n=1 Tax=Pichia sorbitophila (strain ATCC MYA-4447 / BCRC 22081 / CBS 7064 / NBRC 10061 / NRRL Y-12695) TaxID=559304 RepID=G8YP42_PICSO|nr:Piso0_001794 [Millerozyma farinosa CBS 7064]